MASKECVADKPHAVCVPVPALGHINLMLKLAKLLHHKGFHITFVNTESNHKLFLNSLGPNSLDSSPDFQFETIPDVIPAGSEAKATLFYEAIKKDLMLAPFRELLLKLNGQDNIGPPVTCVVYDWMMSFANTAAEELGVHRVLYLPSSAACFMGCKQYSILVEKGLPALKDDCGLTNGFLDVDKVLDWITRIKVDHSRDIPTAVRTTTPDGMVFNFIIQGILGANKASAIILATFDALEPQILEALSMLNLPPVYAIGPQPLLANQEDPLNNMGHSLWKEEANCLQWLDSKEPNSVIYVSFGSVAVISPQHLVEFGWGLANSNVSFIWVIRPDLVVGESEILPPEFVAETKERGLIVSWCPQEQVLNHPSVGGFLTHCGWNSVLESLCAGVPMLCWPLNFDQPTNCWAVCNDWGIGMKLSDDVKRDEVEKLVRELMHKEKGEKMRIKALEWKKLAEDATAPHGSSSKNLEAVVNQVLLR